jgi:hypothetical protein
VSSRAQTVAFHVGAHKTGTSLIQRFMRAHQVQLLRHRIQYLNRSDTDELVGWGAIVRDSPELLAGDLRRRFRRPWLTTVIASHENTVGRPFVRRAPHLYPRAASRIDALARVLEPYEAKIVLSIRPQAGFLESYYLQTVHQGSHLPFRRWLKGIDLDALSWQPLVDQLVAAFGADRVEILDFRRLGLGQESYLQDFFALIDADLQLDTAYEPVRNPSISQKGLRIALAANRHLDTDAERKAMRVFLQERFSNLDYPRPVLLTEAQRESVGQRYDGEYEALVAGSAIADRTTDTRKSRSLR